MEALFTFTALLAVTCLIGHWLHMRRINWITEGSLALMVGLAAGGATYLYYEVMKGVRIPPGLFSFDTEVFLDVCLPIIIFNAGFSVKKKMFFQNFLTLVLFGVVGTFLTAGAIAAGSYYTLDAVKIAHAKQAPSLVEDSLSLGAIFASSDSIATLQILDQEATPMLYSLVFGEGVVNDATSIVLLKAIQKMSGAVQLTGGALSELLINFSQLFVFSLILGVGVGLLSAALIKMCFVKHSTDREVGLVALMGFLAFLLAESLHLSGIFAVFFAGITMSHYTWHGLSPSAKVVTVYLFRILSFLTELFLFLYAGFGCWSTSLWHGGIYRKRDILQQAGVLAGSLLLQVYLARGAVLLVLVPLANLWRPKCQRMGWKASTVIWWAGSARGAVTVALAYKGFAKSEDNKGGDILLHNQMVVVASMAVVIFTTVVLGAVTESFLSCLIGEGEGGGIQPLPSYTPAPDIDDGPTQPLLGTGGWGALQRLGHWNKGSYIHDLWHKVDADIMQPLFGGRKRCPDTYHSPPPSPGRQTMYQVLAPHVMKRLSRDQQTKSGGSQEVEAAPAAAAAAGPEARARIPPPVRTTSRKTTVAAAGDRDDDAELEALFRAPSMRRREGSGVEEDVVHWDDSGRFGEDAYLAAGAPDEPPPRGLPTEGSMLSMGEQQGAGRRGGRCHPHLPPRPSPFDKYEDEE